MSAMWLIWSICSKFRNPRELTMTDCDSCLRKFEYSPDFSIDSLHSLNQPQDEPFQFLIEDRLFIGLKLDRGGMYFAAKRRYEEIKLKYFDKLNEFPLLVLIFAECHFLLSDLHGCLEWLDND